MTPDRYPCKTCHVAWKQDEVGYSYQYHDDGYEEHISCLVCGRPIGKTAFWLSEDTEYREGNAEFLTITEEGVYEPVD